MAPEHALFCGLPVRIKCAWRGISVWIPFSTRGCQHKLIFRSHHGAVKSHTHQKNLWICHQAKYTTSMKNLSLQNKCHEKQLVHDNIYGNTTQSARTSLPSKYHMLSNGYSSNFLHRSLLSCSNSSHLHQNRHFHSRYFSSQRVMAEAEHVNADYESTRGLSQHHFTQNSQESSDSSQSNDHRHQYEVGMDVDYVHSSSDGTAAHSPSAHAHFSWLAQHVPAFSVSGDDVQVIHEPKIFYETLKSEAESAKKRIVWSSLYLGTGELEQELVKSVHESLKSNPDLSVHVLLDKTRGLRGSKNSSTMLQPVITDFPDRAQLSLYHTPDLRGVMKRIVPERYNEVVGLQHMKLYIYDDTVIISGANLSDSYFTNRQDRYIVIRNCEELADFLVRLVEAVSSFSFQLHANGDIKLHKDMPIHPYEDPTDKDGSLFKAEAQRRVEAVISTQCKPPNHKSASSPTTADTLVFPLTQMGPFGITVDNQVTTKLFCDMPEDSRIYLASGYFNLTDHYRNVIVSQSPATFDILTASPEANGFFGGSGISGSIPAAYTYVSRCFLHQVSKGGRESDVRLHEYFKSGWTFHSKGLWAYLPGQEQPSLTLFGSPNFGHRSTYRDLELQVAMVTDNKNLQNQLHQEQTYMFENSSQISTATLNEPDRRSPLWVKVVTTIIKNFL